MADINSAQSSTQAHAMTDRSVCAAKPTDTQRVEIVAYDPAWPDRFKHEAAKIRAALGVAALNIEHVGSTAVPGLPAKPVIDIHLTVRDASEEAGYLQQLNAAGYRLTLREPDWFEHRMLQGDDPLVNLHVFTQGCAEVERCRLFRDWLRISAEDRSLYAGVKQKLAARPWQSVQQYAEAKNPVVASIMARALAWRDNLGTERALSGPVLPVSESKA
jgi:GrpB-like predicted nucleotidyltransferase (UPF0157 family)